MELVDKAHTSSRREVDFSLGRPPSRPGRIWSDGGALPAGAPHAGRSFLAFKLEGVLGAA
jgi:hypothetical protein